MSHMSAARQSRLSQRYSSMEIDLEGEWEQSHSECKPESVASLWVFLEPMSLVLVDQELEEGLPKLLDLIKRQATGVDELILPKVGSYMELKRGIVQNV